MYDYYTSPRQVRILEISFVVKWVVTMYIKVKNGEHERRFGLNVACATEVNCCLHELVSLELVLNSRSRGFLVGFLKGCR